METIFAISTPPGIGGIAVVRLSGSDAIRACEQIFTPTISSHRLQDRPSHTLTYGTLYNDITTNSSSTPLDDVVVALYRAPHSFTGEDVVEISCHGSLFIQQEILRVLASLKESCSLPIRMAEPGEFTRRAFANGRMDLSQAEAVADLIASQNAATHRLALSQMKGSFSKKLDELREQLLKLNSLLELELDFSEEDVEFADRNKLLALAKEIDNEVVRLSETFQTGQAIKNGIPVAIIGETNAGKSTLLNHLLGDDRALVSDVHGTTRDVIEDTILLKGQLVRFIDTAGIRDTKDKVEYMGIERTYQRLSQARIVLWMIDGTRLGDLTQAESCAEDAIQIYHRIAPHLNDSQQLIIVINKVDLVSPARLAHNLPLFQGTLNHVIQIRSDHSENGADQALTPQYVTLSAKRDQNMDSLKELLIRATRLPEISSADVILTNQRHYQAMQEAHISLQQVVEGLTSHRPTDLVAEDLKQVLSSLNSILGRSITSQETLNNIFSHFCIGK